MKFSQKSAFACALAVLVLLAFASSAVFAEKDAKAKEAAPANQVAEQGWMTRCDKPKKAGDKKSCEIYNRLLVQSTSARVVEFAIGFSPGKTDMANGVIIFPLGILLEPGAQIKIDDSKPIDMKFRFCTNAGCFSYVHLDKSFMDAMKKGKTITFSVKSSEGRGINLVMHLSGFGKVLQEIQ